MTSDVYEAQVCALVKAGVWRVVHAQRKRKLQKKGHYVWWNKQLGKWMWSPLEWYQSIDMRELAPLPKPGQYIAHSFGEDTCHCPRCGSRTVDADDNAMRICTNPYCLYQFEEDLTEG